MSAGSGSTSPPPGWYPEPGSGRQRWWDGSSWGDYAPSSLPPVGGGPGAGAPGGGAPGGGVPGGGAPYGGGPGAGGPVGGAPLGGAPLGGAPLGGAPVGGYPLRAGTNGFAIASLVLGILWGYGVLSILAIIFAAIAFRQMPQRAQGGRGLAIAGLVLGILGVIGALIIIIAGIVVSNSTTSSGY